MSWRPDDMGDCSRQRVVITGANSGIGLEAARALVARGATVTLACRDQAKGEAAAASLTGAGTARARRLDLADQQSVRDFAALCATEDAPITGLVCNAGIMACPFSVSIDGLEMQMATNHFGHALLTALLWEALAADARIVIVSSLAARGGKLSASTTVADLVAPLTYSRQGVYSNTKQANLLFAQELTRRLAAQASKRVVVAVHPGVAATELFNRQMKDTGLGWLVPLARPALKVILQPARAGAWPTLKALTDPGLKGGELIGPVHLFQARGAPGVIPIFPSGADVAAADRLWDLTEEILETPLPLSRT